MIDKRIYMLTTIAFVVGMAELIVGGILDLIAIDLDISISRAGLLISVFSVIFAISAPILLIIFAKMERTRLTFLALIIFFLGNVVAILSPTFGILIVSRIISAASGSLAVILCINLASNIVEPAFRGRAIGLVIMGVSGSIVLGLPIGVMLGNMFTWRAPFILIATLTVLLIIAVPIFLGKVAPKKPISLRTQINTLKNYKITFAHLTTFFFLAGHFTLYGYLTPFSKKMLDFDGMMISILYLVYGVAAVSGGGIGGLAADYFGKRRSILTVIALLAISLLVVPNVTKMIVLFWLVVIVWGVMSWAITPPIQSHLMELSPETSDIQQSLNNAALHLGIAFGTFFGSVIIQFGAIEQNAYFGVIFIVIAFITAFISTNKESRFAEKVVRST